VTQAHPYTLQIDRVLNAPRAVVWRYWTEAELVKQWFCPKPWTVPKADFDLRPGGRMNTVMRGPDGTRVENIGCWLEIVPQERLTFTDSFAEGYIPQPSPFMTGFVVLSDTGAGSTRMIWGARHATEEAMKSHLDMGFEESWNAAADQLEALARQLAG
jgi:uncharacterized protein YndB with AHSA1/START domain